MDSVRVTAIQISKLFDDINYNIVLPDGKPIAIITAPNGCGKTTILNLLDFVLDPTSENYKPFRGVPFDAFNCILSNGKTIQLRRTKTSAILPSETTKRNASSNASIRRQESRTSSLLCNGDYEYVVLEKGKPCGDPPASFATIINSIFHGDPYSLVDDDDEFRSLQRDPGFGMHYVEKALTRYLEQVGCIKPVNFIRADRLQPVNHTPKEERVYEKYYGYDEPRQTSPLKAACDDLSDRISRATDEYSDAVSRAKDDLPEKYLASKGKELDYREFSERWNKYRGKLNNFQKIGLISETKDFTEGINMEKEYTEKGMGTFLSTYLEAFENTTDSLIDLYNRLSLFQRILEERNAFTGKKFVFGKNGITVHVNNREIGLETLSSGEKHDLIMFYNLIFESEQNGLVLIDEPEISLHIAWQESYLDKLIEICKMNSLQAIIATHSPSIVSSHYDCVVDKGESHG